MRRWATYLYETGMIALALVVVWLLTVSDAPWANSANLLIWGIFVADYVIRLARAPNRLIFVRQNIPDLVAIMPLDFLRVARVARLVRLVRMARVAAAFWRVSRDVRAILGTNGLGYVLTFAVSLTVVGGVAIWQIEPAVKTVGAGIWWSTVTVTTVGYGDIVPVTVLGRVVAVLLMIIGMGTIGMVTGSIATYFLAHRAPVSPHIEYLRQQLLRWEQLSTHERKGLVAMVHALLEGHNSPNVS